MNIDMDRLALLIGRLMLQAEASGQQIEKLTKDLDEAKKDKSDD